MRSFAVTVPLIWNSLPAALQIATLSPLTFARHLKADLFGWSTACLKIIYDELYKSTHHHRHTHAQVYCALFACHHGWMSLPSTRWRWMHSLLRGVIRWQCGLLQITMDTCYYNNNSQCSYTQIHKNITFSYLQHQKKSKNSMWCTSPDSVADFCHHICCFSRQSWHDVEHSILTKCTWHHNNRLRICITTDTKKHNTQLLCGYYTSQLCISQHRS